MSQLYEKISHGDRQTIVKKFPKGKELYFDGSTIVLKTNAALKVTQEYDASARLWKDVKYDLASMVEIPEGELYNRPPPTSMPGAGEPREPLPRAEVNRSWWRFW